MRKIEKLFNKGCVDYGLLRDGDRILVALSGGKDSLMLLRLLAMRSRIFKPRFEVEAAHVIMDNIPYITDTGYLDAFCSGYGIKLHVLHSSFDENTDGRRTKCFLCSWNRRKTLFEFAEKNGFNKIALGHHQDDIITTLLMNMTFEGATGTMPPMLSLKNYGLVIIRPLCLVHEDYIREVAEREGFQKQKKACPYEDVTKRKAMNDLFHKMEAINPEARYSLWNAMMNIQTDRLPVRAKADQ
ncbi:MAG: tRNA 2-thiocytidine biosynthesis TtcA family protein [Bacteroides sp.]|nr:tRNA 2-thiocytidine biosynthesis TtcA family protein [Roseburia sp.]MCM1347668.1 tRNA 2-thiocytidine biosynthesis TtcA family protein [Bacteroides sp.]MCM1421949.1 tRNA 2-thiocytidine biosynthesis TtcA family protein [Bacteroides sp.]